MSPPPATITPPPARRVKSKIWQTCAGPSVNVPKVRSKVYYFPQGHLEHACPSPNAQTITVIDGYRPSFPCVITAVDLLADPHTDEVFAKLLLSPVTETEGQESSEVFDEEDDGDKFVSFVKTLTKSDSNNGGGFSVPRICADLIFPKLDLNSPFPSQQLSVADVHDGVWKFAHVYRGRPKRHLFTTGWTPFVNTKKLVAGDSIVFMKNTAGDIVVGIRRNMKFAAAEAKAVNNKKEEEGKENGLEVKGEGFSRGGRSGMLTEKAVIEAVESAEKNMAFEVIYYPRANWCNFVVDANVVDDAMKIGWASGMRVKLPLKMDESSNSKMTFFQPQGTISSVSNVPNWRMLQVLFCFGLIVVLFYFLNQGLIIFDCIMI